MNENENIEEVVEVSKKDKALAAVKRYGKTAGKIVVGALLFTAGTVLGHSLSKKDYDEYETIVDSDDDEEE